MGKRASEQIKAQHIQDMRSLRKSSLKIIGVCGIIIFLITFMIYTPSLKNGFVDWDDYTYIYENTNINVLSARALYGMLTTSHANNWHPLTWLSHAVDYSMFGLNPWGHHLGGIILHAFNTLLVFILVLQLVIKCEANKQGSLERVRIIHAIKIGVVTALLFGIHPMHVESVVWLSERKDLLCAFFVLLCACAYIAYVAVPTGRTRRLRFTVCIVLAALALMSKPMAVSLPFILLLMDVYPLRRFSGDAGKAAVLLEKIPFVIMSVAAGIVTLRVQHTTKTIISGFEDFEILPLSTRLLNGVHALVFYLQKMFVPRGLSPLYPYPLHIQWSDLHYIGSTVLVALITAFSLRLSMRGRHIVSSAWFYYVITLLPVIGIIQVGMQAAADRYIYLPGISIFLLAGVGIVRVWDATLLKRYAQLQKGCVLLTLFCILFLLGMLTVRQIGVWRTSENLWKYVVAHAPTQIPIAYNNLGNALMRAGKLEEAVPFYEKALTLNQNLVEVHYNLGYIYSAMKMADKAISEYEEVLAINPNHARAHNNLGFVYYTKGLYDKAMAEYEKALAINPNHARAHNNLGLTFYAKGMLDEAIAQYERALAINPNVAMVYNNLGLVYYKKRNYSLAKEHFDKALMLGYKVDPKLLESITPDR